jgi:Heat shock protein
MKSKTVLVLMSIFLVLTFTSGFAAKSKVSKGTSVNSSTNTNKLLHTSWRLRSVSEKALKKVVIEGREENIMITLNFSSDIINGSGGVNNYTAGYKIKGNNISLTQIGSTLRAGFPELMKAEQNYFQILQNVKTFELKGDMLTLKSDNGTLLFSKMPN